MPELEYDDQSYYPGCKLTLSVRFDEFGDPKVAQDAKKVLTKNPIKLSGKVDKQGQLAVKDDPDAPAGVQRKVLGTKGNKVTPANTTASADERTFDVGGIIPKEAHLGVNGLRHADTLTLTIRYIDMPVDPRIIRSCAVSFYLGTLSAEEFARGVAGQTRGDALGQGVAGAGDPLNVIPSEYVDESGAQRTNLRFQGWVDEWTVEMENGEPVIRLECRDNSVMLIDQIAPPKLGVDAKLPIHEAVATYLANFPQFNGMAVEYRPGDGKIPKLEDLLAKTAFRPKLGPGPAKGAGGNKLSVIDYLTDVTRCIGHLFRVEGNLIIIQPVRSYTATAFSGRTDDPFQGRSLPSGKFTARRFIYGRNVKEMKLTRRYAKSAPTNVEVRCYSGRKKTTLVVRFPLKGDISGPVGNPLPGDSQEQKWVVHTVSGIEDVPTLRLVAQGYYEQQGRNELGVTLKTHNLASFGGSNLDPDILDMKDGDSFELLVNRDEDELNSITKVESMLLAQGRARDFMNALGFNDKFSAAYAKAYSDSDFQTVFRCKTIGFNWSSEEGVTIEIQGANYIEVRLDRQLPAGEEPVPGKAAKAGP